MTTVTVSVAATWRLSRVEFNTPYNAPHVVLGYGEMLLEEPDGKAYGTMPSERVQRSIAEVVEETVEINGTTVSFDTILQALPKFFEKWRVEDLEKPPPPAEVPTDIPTPATMTPVVRAQLTPPEEEGTPKPIGL